jgi:cob(I)alamin adenosyltransferase
MSIYTKTGDDGTTSLYGGKRILKCEELVDVYGSIDELNSWMGFVISNNTNTTNNTNNPISNNFLVLIQEDLMVIGSTLAGWKGNVDQLDKRVPEMEKMIDEMEKELPKLNNFIIPGGSELASQVHIARSICRRVERQTVKYFHSHKLPATSYQLIIKYLNRLSDLLFMFARYINKQEKIPEQIWSVRTK